MHTVPYLERLHTTSRQLHLLVFFGNLHEACRRSCSTLCNLAACSFSRCRSLAFYSCSSNNHSHCCALLFFNFWDFYSSAPVNTFTVHAFARPDATCGMVAGAHSKAACASWWSSSCRLTAAGFFVFIQE